MTDPRGSLLFVSELFAGSISDKEICTQSGFFDLLSSLKNDGSIQDGDAVMADKGFTIGKELLDIGLGLNIPPFAASNSQMSSGEVAETRKIASHRVHVERAINRIKNFKFLSRRVKLCDFSSINQIWTVCAYLTIFMEPLVKKEEAV